jgi:SAM-dependent methyltransferase
VTPAPSGTELLDRPDADPAAVRTSLGNIARANRWFGGNAAVVHGVERLLGVRPTSRLTLLDLGTGAGDIPAALREWGAARGTRVRTFGLERLPPAATLARSAELPVALGCASALPFRSGAVDIVILSQLLHHFERDAAVRILREGARVARCGVVVADLLRSRTAAALFGLGARVLGFDHHTRVDGITSVGRGYDQGELAELFRAAGLAVSTAVRPGWRVVAWGSRA